jgi:hypothetical protein
MTVEGMAVAVAARRSMKANSVRILSLLGTLLK